MGLFDAFKKNSDGDEKKEKGCGNIKATVRMNSAGWIGMVVDREREKKLISFGLRDLLNIEEGRGLIYGKVPDYFFDKGDIVSFEEEGKGKSNFSSAGEDQELICPRCRTSNFVPGYKGIGRPSEGQCKCSKCGLVFKYQIQYTTVERTSTRCAVKFKDGWELELDIFDDSLALFKEQFL